jgi:hypothetical protein
MCEVFVFITLYVKLHVSNLFITFSSPCLSIVHERHVISEYETCKTRKARKLAEGFLNEYLSWMNEIVEVVFKEKSVFVCRRYCC